MYNSESVNRRADMPVSYTHLEAAESEIVSVKVNCSVQSEGHRLDTIEVLSLIHI